MHTFRVAVCSLPGNRFAGARRSLVADLGKLGVTCSEDKILSTCSCAHLTVMNIYNVPRRILIIIITAYAHRCNVCACE